MMTLSVSRYAIQVLTVSLVLPLEAATVRGTVVDNSGTSIPAALVEVVNPYEPSGGILKYLKTDNNGFFSWDGLSPGLYMVFASKEQADYGDTRFAMFSDGLKVPEVKILGVNDTVDVTVNIGRPGSVVGGLVIDNITKKALSQVKLKVALDQKPDKYTSLAAGENGTFQVLLPSRSILISARRIGYQESTLSLVLNPDEHRQVTIKLSKGGSSNKGEH